MLQRVLTVTELRELGFHIDVESYSTPAKVLHFQDFRRIRDFLFLQWIVLWAATAYCVFNVWQRPSKYTIYKISIFSCFVEGVGTTAEWLLMRSVTQSQSRSPWDWVCIIMGIVNRTVFVCDWLLCPAAFYSGHPAVSRVAFLFCAIAYAGFLGTQQFRSILALFSLSDHYTLSNTYRSHLIPDVLTSRSCRQIPVASEAAVHGPPSFSSYLPMLLSLLGGWVRKRSCFGWPWRSRRCLHDSPPAPLESSGSFLTHAPTKYHKYPDSLVRAPLEPLCHPPSKRLQDAVTLSARSGPTTDYCVQSSLPTSCSQGRPPDARSVTVHEEDARSLHTDFSNVDTPADHHDDSAAEQLKHSSKDCKCNKIKKAVCPVIHQNPQHTVMTTPSAANAISPQQVTTTPPTISPPDPGDLSIYYPSYTLVLYIFQVSDGIAKLKRWIQRAFHLAPQLRPDDTPATCCPLSQESDQSISVLEPLQTASSVTFQAEQMYGARYLPAVPVPDEVPHPGSFNAVRDRWLVDFVTAQSSVPVPSQKVAQLTNGSQLVDRLALQNALRRIYISPANLESQDFSSAVIAAGRCFLADILLCILKVFLLMSFTSLSTSVIIRSFVWTSTGVSLVQALVVCLYNTVDEDIWHEITFYE